MGWLDGLLRAPPGQGERDGGVEEEDVPGVERRSPGLALLFEGLSADGRHAILDLGLASASRLTLLGPFSRQIRFAGLVPPDPTSETPLVESIPADPRRPFDVVLAWDILDYLGESGGRALVRRLDAVTTDDAVLYAAVSSQTAGGASPAVRMELVALDRVRHDTTDSTRPTSGGLLPARVEKVLSPFRVVRAISLRMGLREYVARKGPRAGG